MAPNLALCSSPPKSYACTRAPPSLSRPYTRVILLEKHNFIKLGEKPNCLKIGTGRAPAPRSVCEAFRGFRQLRVFPQAIANQSFPLLPSEKSQQGLQQLWGQSLQHTLPLTDCWASWGVQKIKGIKTKSFLTSEPHSSFL